MIARDKQMILNPNKWNRWPFLPMIHRTAKPGMPNTALIVGDPTKDGKVFFVPGANIWAIDQDFINKNGVKRDIDELLAEGWMID